MLVKRIVGAVGICVGIALMVLSAPAWAISRGDPNDSESRLDIRLISENARPHRGGALTIRMFRRWGSRYLRDALPTNLRWRFDDGDDGDFDLVGKFRFTDGALRFFLRGPDTGNIYEPLRARRPDRRSVKVRFSFDIEELQSNRVSVVASSFDGGPDCPGDPCRDRAPDTGRMDI
jgi:hypothetical protein